MEPCNYNVLPCPTIDLCAKGDRHFLRKRRKGRSPVALKNQPSLIYLEGGASFMQNVA
ncbi:MAG: hypothetical protein ACBR20_07525 [Microcoleus sp.]